MIKAQDMRGKVRVLVVDDSAFFRRYISNILSLNEMIEVVGTAGDGMAAIEAAHRLKPDVITMDVEMPIMDGITAVTKIVSEVPTSSILMLSSYTGSGARAALDALHAGAVDFIPKHNSSSSKNTDRLSTMLVQKVLAIGNKRVQQPISQVVGEPAMQVMPSRSREAPKPVRSRQYDLVVVGASTGGPVAIQNLICGLPPSFTVPMVLVVHMPGNFTKAFAERLDSMCALNVQEAVDGDLLQPGRALLAPGGKQLSFVRKGANIAVSIRDGKPNETYKPSIDTTLESAALAMGDSVLAVILTGMGSDGCSGASMLKQCNSTVWSQDQASCVVYGMPQAVEKRGLSDRVLPLDEIGPALVRTLH